MEYYLLGRTGLRVSRLCLGTMTFGMEWGWGSEKEQSEQIFNKFLEAGGNFLDTADIYTAGTSEQWLGEFINKRKLREKVVVSTKFSWKTIEGNPNGGGNGRKYILSALDASLRRLGTDYVDLYLMHVWDGVTPIDDVMRTFDDIVSSGKARHVGFSDVPAWVASRGKTIAECRHTEQPSTVQLEYSLVERNIEHEFSPMAMATDLEIMVWSPLGSGLLSGKYRVDNGKLVGDGRFTKLEGTQDYTLRKNTPKNLQILTVVQKVAEKLGKTPAQIALNWVANQPGVGSVVIGATKLAQLEENLACLDFKIDADSLKELDEVSRPDTPFPYSFFADDFQTGVHAGDGVVSKPPHFYQLRHFPGDQKPLL